MNPIRLEAKNGRKREVVEAENESTKNLSNRFIQFLHVYQIVEGL
jgi:hypothetical protein